MILYQEGALISRCVRKRAESVGNTSFYFVSTAGNHYYKVVAQNPPSTGVGGMNPIQAYFAQHPKQLLAFKYFVVYGLGFVVTYVGALETNGLISQSWTPFVAVALGMIENEAKILDPNTPWPFTGAQKK